jgi:hypothetical protein
MKTKDQYIIIKKEEDNIGRPILCTIARCRGGGAISIIINHHESINAKSDDILWRIPEVERTWLGILGGV